MKRLTLLGGALGLVMYLAGCGSGSSGNSNSNNGGANNGQADAGEADAGADCPQGQSESDVEGYEGQCLDECTIDRVEFQNFDSCPPTHSCRAFNCVPNDACETRTDCEAAAECIDSVCNRHLSCKTIQRDKVNDGECSYEWKGCEDSRSYLVDCEWNVDDQTVDCRCLVNDVEVGTFRPPENVCSPSGLAPPTRSANEACDLLLPLPN